MACFHFIVFLKILILICDVASVKINIELPKDNKIQIIEGQQHALNYEITELDKSLTTKLKFVIADTEIASVDREYEELYQKKTFKSSLNIKGKYIGLTQLNIFYETSDKKDELVQLESVRIVTAFDKNNVLSDIFTGLVAVLVSLNTVNMGCALDLDIVKKSLKSPVNLLVGFFTHYVLMPVFAYLIGKFLFEDQEHLRLSLFIFGCSPSGSGANMWSVLLNANLNLSITMTFLSTLFAAFMMPLWLFTLGVHIFESNKLSIPYMNILTSLFTMIFCIGVGLLIQRFRPKLAQKSKKILAPICGFLIAFVVIFASICYWYLFKLMTVKIFLSAALNVWLGFLFGIIFSLIFRRTLEDLISITLETGIVNTGIAFIIIRFALDSPEQDFAMTIPIASSVVTAIPLTIAFIVLKCRNRYKTKDDDGFESVRSKDALEALG